MTDIVKRLRDWKEYDEGKINDARFEAAAEITTLRAEVERLRAALRDIIADSFSVYAIEVARAALEEKP